MGEAYVSWQGIKAIPGAGGAQFTIAQGISGDSGQITVPAREFQRVSLKAAVASLASSESTVERESNAKVHVGEVLEDELDVVGTLEICDGVRPPVILYNIFVLPSGMEEMEEHLGGDQADPDAMVGPIVRLNLGTVGHFLGKKAHVPPLTWNIPSYAKGQSAETVQTGYTDEGQYTVDRGPKEFVGIEDPSDYQYPGPFQLYASNEGITSLFFPGSLNPITLKPYTLREMLIKLLACLPLRPAIGRIPDGYGDKIPIGKEWSGAELAMSEINDLCDTFKLTPVWNHFSQQPSVSFWLEREGKIGQGLLNEDPIEDVTASPRSTAFNYPPAAVLVLGGHNIREVRADLLYAVGEAPDGRIVPLDYALSFYGMTVIQAGKWILKDPKERWKDLEERFEQLGNVAMAGLPSTRVDQTGEIVPLDPEEIAKEASSRIAEWAFRWYKMRPQDMSRLPMINNQDR